MNANYYLGLCNPMAAQVAKPPRKRQANKDTVEPLQHGLQDIRRREYTLKDVHDLPFRRRGGPDMLRVLLEAQQHARDKHRSKQRRTQLRHGELQPGRLLLHPLSTLRVNTSSLATEIPRADVSQLAILVQHGCVGTDIGYVASEGAKERVPLDKVQPVEIFGRHVVEVLGGAELLVGKVVFGDPDGLVGEAGETRLVGCMNMKKPENTHVAEYVPMWLASPPKSPYQWMGTKS